MKRFNVEIPKRYQEDVVTNTIYEGKIEEVRQEGNGNDWVVVICVEDGCSRRYSIKSLPYLQKDLRALGYRVDSSEAINEALLDLSVRKPRIEFVIDIPGKRWIGGIFKEVRESEANPEREFAAREIPTYEYRERVIEMDGRWFRGVRGKKVLLREFDADGVGLDLWGLSAAYGRSGVWGLTYDEMIKELEKRRAAAKK